MTSNSLYFDYEIDRPFAPAGLGADEGFPESIREFSVSPEDDHEINSQPVTSLVLKTIQENYSDQLVFFHNNNRLSVAVFDFEHVKDILSKNQASFLKGKSEVVLGSAVGWGLLTAEESNHSHQRRQLSPAFHRKMQEQYSVAIRNSLKAHQSELTNPDGFELTPTLRRLMHRISLTGFMGLDSELIDFSFD